MPALTNRRHELFAQARAKGASADSAYVIAGFSANRGNAARLNANEGVRARIDELMRAGADRAEVTIEQVVRELAKIGFSDMRKLLKWGGTVDGFNETAAEETGEVRLSVANLVQLFDSDDLDDDMAACISEISQTKDGALKVKLHDKQAALVSIGRHLGMFKDRVEHGGTITVEPRSLSEILGIVGQAAREGDARVH